MKNWPKELKKTPARRAIWTVLKDADRPLTAMDLVDLLRASGETVWLSTVYRTLESFEKYHLVNKNSLPHSEMAYYELNSPEHRHYAVCLGCHQIFPLLYCPLEMYRPQLAELDFELVGHKIELYGYCRTCAQTHPPEYPDSHQSETCGHQHV